MESSRIVFDYCYYNNIDIYHLYDNYNNYIEQTQDDNVAQAIPKIIKDFKSEWEIMMYLDNNDVEYYDLQSGFELYLSEMSQNNQKRQRLH